MEHAVGLHALLLHVWVLLQAMLLHALLQIVKSMGNRKTNTKRKRALKELEGKDE